MGRLRSVGQAKVDDRYFIQRLYIGIEPEEQTSREQKDRYGVFAYAVIVGARRRCAHAREYHVEVDGDRGDDRGTKVYLINSGMMGTGLRITHTYSIDDGLLDCFVLDKADLDTLVAAGRALPGVHTASAARLLPQAPHHRASTWSPTSRSGRTASTSAARPSRSTSCRAP